MKELPGAPRRSKNHGAKLSETNEYSRSQPRRPWEGDPEGRRIEKKGNLCGRLAILFKIIKEKGKCAYSLHLNLFREDRGRQFHSILTPV